MYAVEWASNTRETRTMLGWRKRASMRASCKKLERPHSNVVLCRSDFGLTLMVESRSPNSIG